MATRTCNQYLKQQAVSVMCSRRTLNFQGYSCVPAGNVYALFPDTIRALPSRTSAGGNTICTLYRIYKSQRRNCMYLKCKAHLLCGIPVVALVVRRPDRRSSSDECDSHLPA
jgi:hypothetical protein